MMHMTRNIALLILIGLILCNPFPIAAAETPDLIITEIMKNPDVVDDADGEWIEVYNAGDDDISLEGIAIAGNGDHHTINKDVIVPSNEYAVLCRNEDMLVNSGVPCLYEYTSPKVILGNSDDVVLLEVDGVEIDKVEYDDEHFPDDTGVSMELSDIDQDNSAGSNWHSAQNEFGDGDYGSPGAQNSDAPEPTATPTLTPTNTPVPTKTPKPTQTPNPTPTTTKVTRSTAQTKQNNPYPPIQNAQEKPTLIPLTQTDVNDESLPLPGVTKTDPRSVIQNALGRLDGDTIDDKVQGLHTYGNQGYEATDSAEGNNPNPIPFVILGAVSMIAMGISAFYIHRKQRQKDIENHS